MSTLVRASYVPLFDRLCEQDPASARTRLLDADALQESLQRDLLRLFNVRNSLTLEGFLASEGSVLHYGLPDLLSLCVQSDADLERLTQVVRHAIRLYEPRLTGVTVQAWQDPQHPGRARLAVAAGVIVGRELRRVDFEIDLDEPLARMVPAA